MAGTEDPVRTPITLLTFNSAEDLSQFATGCDGDIGGLTTARLDLDTSSADPAAGLRALQPPRPTGKFWGEMRLGTRPGFENQIRAGYAGFRSKVCTALVRVWLSKCGVWYES